jgi:isopenicillin N synthase-like dioxygenase
MDKFTARDQNMRMSPLVHETRKALEAVPVIDISAFCEGGSVADKRAIAREIRRACIDIGFFYISGHGFTAGDLTETLEWGHKFFALPVEDKMRIAARHHRANLGFIQTGGLHPDAAAASRADRKERFYLSRDLAPGEIEDDASPAGRSQWPAEDVLPGFRQAIERQTAKKVILARYLARAVSLSLELSEEQLEAYHDRMGCIHSFNYYPPLDPALADDLWGFSPHTDYGTFTILQQDRSGGLQARNADGEWIEVPPIDNTFVVNVGDMLARWTNDTYVSTLHRVMNRKPTARLSLSFFTYPNPRARIATLESCTRDGDSRYDPVISGEYIRKLLTQAYETGRSGISSRTAERLAAPQN